MPLKVGPGSAGGQGHNARWNCQGKSVRRSRQAESMATGVMKLYACIVPSRATSVTAFSSKVMKNPAW
jgi:hypothetical protein